LQPKKVGPWSDWDHVSAGGSHTCGHRSDDSIWCWGSNAFGQLGGSVDPIGYIPEPIPGSGLWGTIEAGGLHACAVRTDGGVWCWGNNAFGQLGVGDATDRVIPTRVGNANDWTELSLGTIHTCALNTQKQALCWGSNANGSLGSIGGDADEPRMVASSLVWGTIDAGNGHTCGMAAGTVYCFGRNVEGQIGDGTTTQANVPKAVPGLTSPTVVVAGGNSTLSLTT
jgi:alpha-tubulin suppressor-like RCC1 family protein